MRSKAFRKSNKAAQTVAPFPFVSLSHVWSMLMPSCYYVIWLNLVSDYGIFRACEEMVEFYIAFVIVIALSQALQIHPCFFFFTF